MTPGNGIEIPDSLPKDKAEEFARGMGLLVTATHERDQAYAELEVIRSKNHELQSDLAAARSQIEALKGMMAFAESQARLKETENLNTISTYRAERDKAVTDLSQADARLNCIADLVLVQIRHRAEEITDDKAAVKVEPSNTPADPVPFGAPGYKIPGGGPSLTGMPVNERGTQGSP